MVEGIPYTEAHLHWDKVRPLLERCFKRVDSGYSAEDLLTEVQLRNKQLWMIGDGQAMAITAVVVFPRWKKLTVEYLAGEGMKSWLSNFRYEMECYAEAMGCKYIETLGRKGWLRACEGDDIVYLARKRIH